jgi:Ca2+:H+ antiporter
MIISATDDSQESKTRTILELSRGTAVILLLLYVLYLWFQLRTHHNLFHADPPSETKSNTNSIRDVGTSGSIAAEESGEGSTQQTAVEEASDVDVEEAGEGSTQQTAVEDEQAKTDDEATHMSPWSAGVVLIVTTILVSICADYLVDSIDALVERAHISRNFIGLILIPIVGNAAEHVTAVVVAVKNKMDLVRMISASDMEPLSPGLG